MVQETRSWEVFYIVSAKMERDQKFLTMDELEEYVRFGNAVASLCVEKKGAIPAMPTLAQGEKQIKYAKAE